MKKSRTIFLIIFLFVFPFFVQGAESSPSEDSPVVSKGDNSAKESAAANGKGEEKPVSPAKESQASSGVFQDATPLNKEVRLDVNDTVSKVFRDMVVVQRKAKIKGKHFLFNPILGVDFSDGPATLYTMNMNIGYAINDFWEIYLNYVPTFIVQERGIVKMLGAQEIYNPNECTGTPPGPLNCVATTFKLGYAEPKTQMGAEVLWAPAYGKDSWGPYTMFRSDTFFKIGAYQIDYPTEKKKGLRFAFMGGKTYFAAKYFNVRVAAGLHQMQTFVGNTEADRQRFNTILFLEGGLVFYL